MVLSSFAELTRQVHLLNDLILSDMVYSDEEYAEVAENFSRHLYATKYWFMRTSFANKKRFLTALLHDLRSGWALSLLLKSIWNCRTKDAILSFWNRPKTLSPYDQIPIDHNRTAQPLRTLAQVMTDERRWFHTLGPEAQAMMLLELLVAAGGPVMVDILRRAQLIYEYNRDMQLQNLLECIVVNEQPMASNRGSSEKVKRDLSPTKPAHAGPVRVDVGTATVKPPPIGHAQKDLETNLAAWNLVIKTIRDSQKLEEVEMTFRDGTKKKIWKVNRPKPEAIETVDFLQLLPAAIGKRILSFLPKQSLAEYARVNKYWAYLVDDLNAQWMARNKLNSDEDKLQDMMLKHDTSMDIIAVTPIVAGGPASLATGSITQSYSKGCIRKTTPSVKASEKSAGACSFRHYFDEKMKTEVRIKPKTIQNLAELQERLDRRGAADENLWQWCRYIIKMTKLKKELHAGDGLLRFEEMRFPTPLMKYNLELPLKDIVKKDPAIALAVVPKSKKNVAEPAMDLQKEPRVKRFSLWSRDFSSLYKVLKVASYQSPV